MRRQAFAIRALISDPVPRPAQVTLQSLYVCDTASQGSAFWCRRSLPIHSQWLRLKAFSYLATLAEHSPCDRIAIFSDDGRLGRWPGDTAWTRLCESTTAPIDALSMLLRFAPLILVLIPHSFHPTHPCACTYSGLCGCCLLTTKCVGSTLYLAPR